MLIWQWLNVIDNIQDSTGIPGNTYLYSIITSDEKPNKSTIAPLYINYETGTRISVQDIEDIVDREVKIITLKWNQDNSDVYSYKIYRSKNDGEFRLYKTIKAPKKNEFIDSSLYINNMYHYKIKVVNQSGINSKFSKVIDVTY